jgi:hypothetical protein
MSSLKLRFSVLVAVAIILALLASGEVTDSVITNSIILNSSVRYSRIENSTFCGNFTVYEAIVLNNTLASGMIAYNGSYYYGPFSISNICANIAPAAIGSLSVSPSVVSDSGNVIFTYTAPRIGYTVFIASSELSKLDSTSTAGIFLKDNGTSPDIIANDGIYAGNYYLNILNANTDGNKTLFANITDNLGNKWQRQVNVTLDNTAPNASVSIEDGSISTTTRLVVLLASYNDSIGIGSCRFANEDLSFSPWESCLTLKDWELSTNDGNKTVFLEVRDSAGNIAGANDSIYFNVSGNLDVTEPTTPQVYDEGKYQTNKHRLYARWNATDPESALTYLYRVSYDGHTAYINSSWTPASSATEAELLGLDLIEGKNYTFEVIAINSRNLQSDVGYSDGIIIDTIGPAAPVIASSNNGNWSSSNFVSFNWSAYDNMSFVGSYSYALTSNASGRLDYVAEHEGMPSMLRSSNYDGNYTVLKYNHTGNASAVFLEVKGNMSAGDILIIKALLSESHVDSSQLMGLNAYAVEDLPSAFNEMANNISGIVNLSTDYSFAGIYGAEWSSAEIVISTNVSRFFVALSGDFGDDDNVYNLLLSSSNTSTNSLQSYICIEGSGCLNASSGGFGVSVEKKDVGIDGMWHKQFAVADGRFYFIARGMDPAGNWGNLSEYMISVDSSGPSTPVMLNPIAYVNTTTVAFNWTAANDIDSGIDNYYLEVSNDSSFGSLIYAAFVGNLTNASVGVPGSLTYYARVRARNLAGLLGSFSSPSITSVDITPPQVGIITPQGTIAHSDVVVSVGTDERAVCSYSIGTSPYVGFTFTNSSYHETIIGFASGSNSISVKCSDAMNNQNIDSANFEVNTAFSPGSINIPSLGGIAGRLLYFNISVSSGATQLGGYGKQEFAFRLDGSDYPFSVSDRGNGIYQFAIIAPKSGTYPVEITLGGISGTSTISLSDMVFQAMYSENGIEPSSMDMLTYFVAENFSLGLASNDPSVSSLSGADSLKLSSSAGDLFIFVTRPAAEVSKADNLLSAGTFEDSASFGYGKGQASQTIYAILKYSDVMLIGNETLKSGIYEIVLENDGIDSVTSKKRILIWAR